MTPEQQAALDKIKKLLAMKRGGTQHEAETAEALAQSIAIKVGIDLGRVSLDDAPAAEQPITHRKMGDWGDSVPCEAHYAAQICQRYFNVHSLTIKGWISELYFIGTDADLDIAAYVWKFLLREFRWQWNHRRGRCRKRMDFLWGVYCGLRSKLEERFGKPSEAALVGHHAAKREAYIQEKWGETQSASVGPKKSGRAANNGYFAGRDIEIRGGLKPAPQREPVPRLGANGHADRKLLQPANGQLGLL